MENRNYEDFAAKWMGEAKPWTEDQLKLMKRSNYFFPAKRVRWFRKTHFMRPADYKALCAVVIIGIFVFAVSVAYVIARMCRPGGW